MPTSALPVIRHHTIRRTKYVSAIFDPMTLWSVRGVNNSRCLYLRRFTLFLSSWRPVILSSSRPIVLPSCRPVVLTSCYPVVLRLLTSCCPVVLTSCCPVVVCIHSSCYLLYPPWLSVCTVHPPYRDFFSYLNRCPQLPQYYNKYYKHYIYIYIQYYIKYYKHYIYIYIYNIFSRTQSNSARHIHEDHGP